MSPIWFSEELDTEWQAELIAAYICDKQAEAVLAQADAKRQGGGGESEQPKRERERGHLNPASPRRTDNIRDTGRWE